jgi:acyl-CoA synthetase (AMP-forming)/AMP-acid ligase II
MPAGRAADRQRIIGWLDDPVAGRGIRFRAEDQSWLRYTYRDLAERALRAGAFLAGNGVRRGDVVPLVLPAGPDFVAHFFGLLAIGATPSVLPLPWALRAGRDYTDQIRGVVSRIRPRHAVVDGQFSDLMQQSIAGLDARTVLLPPSGEGQPEDAPRADGDLAAVQFTSGSRGRPRGLRITVANMAANLRMMQEWVRLREYGAVSWLPLYHDMGLIGGLLGTATIQVEHAMLTPEQFLRDTAGWLGEYGRAPYESMVMPNFGFEWVLTRIRPKDLEGLDFSHLGVVISGAERVDPAVLSRFAELLKPYGFSPRALTPAYGLAENTLAVSGVPRHALPRLVRASGAERRLGEKVDVATVTEIGPEPVAEPRLWHVSCGRPMTGMTVEILDENGARQPEGVLGEIFIAGPSVADGYVDGSEEDADRLAGGTLRTGDAGFLLDGELYVVGRLGDSVKINGQSVFVEDIELELFTCTALTRRHAAVAAGMADGEPAVIVVADRRIGSQAEAVLSVVRSFTGDTARAEIVQVKPGTIPVTTSGKPRRRSIWLAYLAGGLGATPAASEVRNI